MERGMQLLDIMNEVSARLDQQVASAPVRTSVSRNYKPMDEIQAFMHLDPLLADLNKQYLDAKSSRLQAEREYGRGDGMTDMAAMMEDSAWCAMQTRYMELRANRGLMSQARDLMDKDRLEEEERTRKEKEKAALNYMHQMQMFARMREASRNDAAGWWIIAMIYFSQPAPLFREHHASYRFNRLAA